MDSTQYMFMIVGVPGTGKSTLAQKLKDNAEKFIRPICGPCEADDYFYIVGKGKYAFNPRLLGKAHAWCQKKAATYATTGRNFIVSNTGLKPFDRKFYFGLAKDYGYKVVFIHLTKRYGSIHDVPEDAIEKMEGKWTDLTSDERALVVKGDELGDDLASLLAACGVDYEY